MIFNTLIASSILAFVQAAPAPIDWNTVSYDVDWKTVSYDVDWATVSYDVDWATVNYGSPAATPTAAAATTPAATEATATATAAADVSGPYSFISSHSGDAAVHLQPIYVNGTVQLGGSPPFSYTPNGVTAAAVSVAQFNVANSELSLNVAVPGGQQVYVNTDGTLGYTVPHSAQTPDGAILTGFSVAVGTSFTELKYDGASQFLACPVAGADGIYDVVVSSKSSRTDCTGVGLLGSTSTSGEAYEWN